MHSVLRSPGVIYKMVISRNPKATRARLGRERVDGRIEGEGRAGERQRREGAKERIVGVIRRGTGGGRARQRKDVKAAEGARRGDRGRPVRERKRARKGNAEEETESQTGRKISL